MHKICAWCGKDIADVSDSNPGVTHGMCTDCEALLEGDRPGSLRHLLDQFKMPVMAIDKEGRMRTANGRVEELPLLPKYDVAHRVLDRVVALLGEGSD